MYNLFSPYLEFNFEKNILNLKLKDELKKIDLNNFNIMIKEIKFSQEEEKIIKKQLEPYKIPYEEAINYGIASYLGLLYVLEKLINLNIPYSDNSNLLVSSNMFNYIYPSLNILVKLSNVKIKKLCLFVQTFINIWSPYFEEGDKIKIELIQQNFNELSVYIFQQNLKLLNEIEQKQKQVIKDVEEQKNLLSSMNIELSKGITDEVVNDVKSKVLYNDIENKLITKIDGLEHRINTLYNKNNEMEKRLFNLDKKPKSIISFEPK